MSKGKYSPTVYSMDQRHVEFDKNCYGKPCVEWSKEVAESGVVFDEKTMFGNYDEEGYDSYGYSAFYADGTYAGIGSGVDRRGFTELDYLAMSDEEFEDHFK